MAIQVTPQLLEALAQVVSGGPGLGERRTIGIYRSGPEIASFMRTCGVATLGAGSRLPALAWALEQVTQRDDAAEVMTRIVEAAANPADFQDPEHHQRVVDYLNVRLAADGMVLTKLDGRMRCVPISQGSHVTSHLSLAAAVFRFDTVQADLKRAIDSADQDPEDAVTAASSLLESLCRSILIEMGRPLPDRKDIATLYKAVREPLGLSAARDDMPPEISDDVRSILGALNTIVQSVGALRTHAGDAHGRERGFKRIDGRIARLAIYTASAAALFLLETWEKQTGRALRVH
jgi:hypothetical protein